MAGIGTTLLAPSCARGSVPDAERVAPASNAALRELPQKGAEGSRYGELSIAVVSDGAPSPLKNPVCRVSFENTSGKVVLLFTVPDCIGDAAGVDTVGPAASVGAVSLPWTAPDGDEFHLFGIATARGGNAVSGSDYWAVVVRRDAVWATPAPFASGDLMSAQRLVGPPAALALEEAPTVTGGAARYTVTFGRVTKP